MPGKEATVGPGTAPGRGASGAARGGPKGQAIASKGKAHLHPHRHAVAESLYSRLGGSPPKGTPQVVSTTAKAGGPANGKTLPAKSTNGSPHLHLHPHPQHQQQQQSTPKSVVFVNGNGNHMNHQQHNGNGHKSRASPKTVANCPGQSLGEGGLATGPAFISNLLPSKGVVPSLAVFSFQSNIAAYGSGTGNQSPFYAGAKFSDPPPPACLPRPPTSWRADGAPLKDCPFRTLGAGGAAAAATVDRMKSPVDMTKELKMLLKVQC